MLGDNIIKFRELKGISLTACAEKIGISAGYLSDIEKNIKTNPSMKILGKISLILGVDTRELLSTEQKLDLAIGSLDKINKTVEQYYESKTDITNVNELQFDADTILLVTKIKKLSEKNRKIVEVLINQLESD